MIVFKKIYTKYNIVILILNCRKSQIMYSNLTLQGKNYDIFYAYHDMINDGQCIIEEVVLFTIET